MDSSLSFSTTPSAASILAAARRARSRYDDLITHSFAGVCIPAGSWRALHLEMFSACCALVELHNSDARPPALTPSVVQELVDRAGDAEARALSAEAKLADAKRGRVIDMGTLQAAWS